MEIANKAAVGSLVLCLVKTVITVHSTKYRNLKFAVQKIYREAKQSKLVFELAFCIYIGSVAYFRKQNGNRV